MSTLQPYANNIYLEWAVGKTAPPAPATLYLTFTDKLISLGGVEVMTQLIGSANRIALTPATYFTQPAIDSRIQNTVNISVTTNCPTTSSVTFGAASVHDSNFPGANMIAETAVQPRTLYNGDWLIILAGALNFSIG